MILLFRILLKGSLPYFLMIFSLGIVCGCGKNLKKQRLSESSPSKKNIEIHEIEPMKGVYHTLLAPLNLHLTKYLNGSLSLSKENDELITTLRLSGGPAKTLITQAIHIGNRCPTAEDDLNQDGFIDAVEALKITDQVIIPLDDDLSSQWHGLGSYPATDEFGYYLWSKETSFSLLMKDLYEDDINQNDNLVKLVPDTQLNLSDHVVLLSGVPNSFDLPHSVKATAGDDPHQNLPIACGVIKKLTRAPGVIDTDETSFTFPEDDIPQPGHAGIDDGAPISTKVIIDHHYRDFFFFK